MSRSGQRKLTRRRVLFGTAAVAATGAAGAIAWQRGSHRDADWVERVVRDNLPGVRIDADSLAKFVSDALASRDMQSRERGLAALLQHAAPSGTGLPRVRLAEADVDRAVLTAFLMGSNFFHVADPTRETIVYYGPAGPCGNPFRDAAPTVGS